MSHEPVNLILFPANYLARAKRCEMEIKGAATATLQFLKQPMVPALVQAYLLAIKNP